MILIGFFEGFIIGIITTYFGYGWLGKDGRINPPGIILNIGLIIFFTLITIFIAEKIDKRSN